MEESSNKPYENPDLQAAQSEAYNEYQLEMNDQSREFIDENLFDAAHSLAGMKNYMLVDLYTFDEDSEFISQANLPMRDGTERDFQFAVAADTESGSFRRPRYKYDIQWSEQSDVERLMDVPLTIRKLMRETIILTNDDGDDNEELLDALDAPEGEMGEEFENMRCYTITRHNYTCVQATDVIQKESCVSLYLDESLLSTIYSAEERDDMDFREVEDDLEFQGLSREEIEQFLRMDYQFNSITEEDFVRMKEVLYYTGLDGGEIEVDITERWNDEESTDVHE